MPVIYNVTIEATQEETVFHIIWDNVLTKTRDWFSQKTPITAEEALHLWQEPNDQKTIGEKLFRFLDGDSRHFKRALTQAHQQGQTLQVYLRTCPLTSDWPFELVADEGEFLLRQKMHLIRWVTDWGKIKPMVPHNRPLKFLFMACSAKDIKPELDYEAEEETIFNITKNLPIDIEVEDSGSLVGLSRQLEQQQFDIVHLSGHANIAANGCPYFVMEDEFGEMQQVSPDELWNNALLENPPRLLFLSGCRTGETPDSDNHFDAVSFAHLLVERHNVPAVLGWGRSVSDSQAILVEEKLFHELSRGKSILEAVQRARYELQENFPMDKRNDWSLLRLFSSGLALNPIVTQGQKTKPTPRRMKDIYLRNSRVKTLAEGFIGRRRQIQQSLRSLQQDYEKVGLLLLGPAGLGKSCLAAKICERLPDFTEIIVHGVLNSFSLEAALKEAFIISQDKKGMAILSRQNETKDKLSQLCAASFKEGRYVILLDDFEQNIEGVATGQPGCLLAEAAELLKTLLHYLPISGKMTQLIMTSSYGFSLTQQNQDWIAQRLEHVYLTSFSESQQMKKMLQLEHLLEYKKGAKALDFMSAGQGNPLFMEILDQWMAQISSVEEEQLTPSIQKKRDAFIQQHKLRELYQRSSQELVKFLCGLSRFNRPIVEKDVSLMATKAGLKNWPPLLVEGIRLGLIEYDQAHQNYQVTPLLREELQAIS